MPIPEASAIGVSCLQFNTQSGNWIRLGHKWHGTTAPPRRPFRSVSKVEGQDHQVAPRDAAFRILRKLATRTQPPVA